jgi:hypothetical protein
MGVLTHTLTHIHLRCTTPFGPIESTCRTPRRDFCPYYALRETWASIWSSVAFEGCGKMLTSLMGQVRLSDDVGVSTGTALESCRFAPARVALGHL